MDIFEPSLATFAQDNNNNNEGVVEHTAEVVGRQVRLVLLFVIAGGLMLSTTLAFKNLLYT